MKCSNEGIASGQYPFPFSSGDDEDLDALCGVCGGVGRALSAWDPSDTESSIKIVRSTVCAT